VDRSVAVGAIQQQQDRIEDLETENAAVRDHLDRIEAELGTDTTASQQGVAHD
jgi:uncharacterized protein (UPF0335 family)